MFIFIVNLKIYHSEDLSLKVINFIIIRKNKTFLLSIFHDIPWFNYVCRVAIFRNIFLSEFKIIVNFHVITLFVMHFYDLT